MKKTYFLLLSLLSASVFAEASPDMSGVYSFAGVNYGTFQMNPDCTQILKVELDKTGNKEQYIFSEFSISKSTNVCDPHLVQNFFVLGDTGIFYGSELFVSYGWWDSQFKHYQQCTSGSAVRYSRLTESEIAAANVEQIFATAQQEAKSWLWNSFFGGQGVGGL
jgi:hypothetical protein